jgi:hypothetical protein
VLGRWNSGLMRRVAACVYAAHQRTDRSGLATRNYEPAAASVFSLKIEGLVTGAGGDFRKFPALASAAIQ